MPKRLPDSPPKPLDIAKELGSIPPNMFRRLTENYRLTYFVSYSADRNGVVSRIDQRVDQSDPTGDVAAEKEKARNKVAFAGREIMAAMKALDRADKALSQLTEWAGKYERVRHNAGEQPSKAASR